MEKKKKIVTELKKSKKQRKGTHIDCVLDKKKKEISRMFKRKRLENMLSPN